LECVQRFERGPALLRAAYDALPRESRTWRPGPERWSALEVLAHCADAELHAAIRIRALLAEERPLIAGFDEKRWAATLDYQSVDPEQAFATITAANRLTTALLKRLPDAAFEVYGTHTQRGEYSAKDWFRMYAEHLEVHARQLERILADWQRVRA
jgi:hypothetical protein